MKKYLALGAATLILMFAVLMIPNLVSQILPSVKITSMKVDRYSEVVYASGTVEEERKTEVSSDFPLVIKKINVSAGDAVKAGDVLMEVDKENTQKLLLELASGTLSSSGESLTMTLLQILGEYSNEQLAALLPDVVTAPVSGVVSRVEASKGTLLFPGTTLAAISQGTAMVATLAVSESDIAMIETGQTVALTGVSDKNEVRYGTVTSIASSARKQLSGTSLETVVDISVKLDQQDTLLKPGYTVNAEIQVEAPRQINLLPYDAIGQDESGEEYVYIYDAAAETAVKRHVVSGVETANGVEITKGVYPSDLVVFDVSTVSGEGSYISVQGRVG